MLKMPVETQSNGWNVVLDNPAKPADAPRSATKAKRSTEHGEGQLKLIAALTKHHEYADGGLSQLGTHRQQ